MKIGITCYPTYGGSGVVATELGIELAARGHEIHFISYAMPIRLTGARAHPFSRSRGDHLSAVRPSALHAGARDENAGSGRAGAARSAARALRHSAFGERAAGAHDGGAEAAAVHHHAARHGHHAGGQRPQLSADHAIFDRAERRRHRHLELPARAHHSGIRDQAADRSDSQFRELRSLHAQRRSSPARSSGPRTASRS